MLRRLSPDDRAIPASLSERGRHQIDAPRPVGDQGVPPEALNVQRQQYAACPCRARGLDRDAVPTFDEEVRDLVESQGITRMLGPSSDALAVDEEHVLAIDEDFCECRPGFLGRSKSLVAQKRSGRGSGE